jgi:hypothetical protein
MKKIVLVTQEVEVEIDETKFSPQFMKEFRESFFQFHTLDKHIEHLAQLEARGVIYNDSFIEGYGNPSDMGISMSIESCETEIIE